MMLHYGICIKSPDLPQEYQVITFDNRDVECSSKATRPYTIADMVHDVVALLDILDVERTHMLGLSILPRSLRYVILKGWTS